MPRFLLCAVLLLNLSMFILSAPAPITPTNHLVPGQWVLMWGNALRQGDLTLGPGNKWEWLAPPYVYSGTYTYDRKTRLLKVNEVISNPEHEYQRQSIHWEATLDSKYEGVAVTSYGTHVRIKIWPKR